MNRSGKYKKNRGSAIIETAVGLFVLLPVFLILLDVIALVIGQTVNDDLAKKAARYAAEEPTQALALAKAQNFVAGTAYAAPTGLVCSARVVDGSFSWNTTQVRVVTEVTINLPVPVPLGGPKSQIMQTQATEPTIGVAATPPT